MTRDVLEKNQVFAYLAAILLGLAIGSAAPGLGPAMEALVWPVLGLLLYATFTQVPLSVLPLALKDKRFTAAALMGNFVLLPLLVWGLSAFLPEDPSVRLGVLMVLLVPCTDWFITFTHQAGGDTGRAIAITPAMLVAQMLALPVYLWLMMGETAIGLVPAGPLLGAFAGVILLPLCLAFFTERWAGADAERALVVARLGWLPVPLLALVLLLVAGSQVEAVLEAAGGLGGVTAVFVAFLVGATALGMGLARAFDLPVEAARTLVFSLSTRNSFVVLPLALALPPLWEAAAVVIVLQSLIELFGVLVLLWLVPRTLLPRAC